MSSDVILFSDVNGSRGFGRYAGTYRLATEIRNLGYSVQTIDFCMSFTIEEICEILHKFMGHNTKFVGISSTFLVAPNKISDSRTYTAHTALTSTSVGWSDEQFSIIANTIRSINPNTHIVVGGAKSDKKDFEQVDYWVHGEGEPWVHDYFNTDKQFNFNTSEIVWDETDYLFPEEHLPIEIARGCIFKCSFCSYQLNGKKMWDYVKNPDIVQQEMIRNWEQNQTYGYMFCDDTFNDTLEKVKSYHKMLTNLPFQPIWSTYLRLDLIASKPEMIDLLYESGCRSVFFGIETFNQTAGKHVGKGMDPDLQKETLYQIREAWPDVSIGAGFIAGLPYETPDSLLSTIQWLNKEDCPIDAPSLQVLSLGKKSQLGSNPMEFGITRTDNGWESEWTTSREMQEIVNANPTPYVNNFTFYNRLHNLGFANNSRNIAPEDLTDVDQRYYALFSEYKRKII